jgi:3-oxoacyl-[acyl-carrier protein] reductase
MRLKDQIALVTGGSRGIGRAIVKAFAAEGAKVAVVYRGSKEAADSLVQEVTQTGGVARALQADVADPAAAQACVEQVEKELGPVDILVNNAGVIQDDLFVRMEPEAWNKVLQTNLGGTYNFCRAVAYSMMRRRGGRIINVSSVAAQVGGVVGPHYAASKAGLHGLTHAYASLLAKEGITVNCVAPALIETEMVTSNPRASPGLIPVGRFGAAEEVASVAVLLATNGYVTGQTVNVNGGWYMT